MTTYLVWYTDGTTKHFETEKEVIKNLDNAETITGEFWINNKYVGETDYSVEEWKKNFEENKTYTDEDGFTYTEKEIQNEYADYCIDWEIEWSFLPKYTYEEYKKEFFK